MFRHRPHHHLSEDVCCCHYGCLCLSRLKVCFSLAKYVLEIDFLSLFVAVEGLFLSGEVRPGSRFPRLLPHRPHHDLSEEVDYFRHCLCLLWLKVCFPLAKG